MANGTVFLSKLNSILLYTADYLRYIDRSSKYTYRDIDFQSSSDLFLEVINNIEITQEEKTSLMKFLETHNLDHLDLPPNYRTLIANIVPVTITNVSISIKYEYINQRLAKAFIDMFSYLLDNNIDTDTFNILDYLTDLNAGNATADQAIFTAITNVINSKENKLKLNDILKYKTNIVIELTSYIMSVVSHKEYLYNLYKSESDAYKPNDLPILVMA